MAFTHIESLKVALSECEGVLRRATANMNQAKDIAKRAERDYMQVQQELVTAMEAALDAQRKKNEQ